MSNFHQTEHYPQPGSRRIFLLSPANIGGTRAAQVMSASSRLEMAICLRDGGVPLGDLFSFMSGLYFRGKLAYARAFSNAPLGTGGAYVITSRAGLILPETLVTLHELQRISGGDVDSADPEYIEPLARDARFLAQTAGANCQIVFLGSIAASKYVDPLLGVFGAQLLFPAEFVGRGDMSRGGLMLRCVESAEQLTYIPVLGAMRHGPKPPRLKPLPRQQLPSAIAAVSGASPS